MGSSASKPARTAASAIARRQYPKQPSPSTTRAPPPSPLESQGEEAAKTQEQSGTAASGPKFYSKEQVSDSRTEAIDLDGRDPHFAASLRSIGPVIPNPTLSHSSTFNASQSQTQSHAQSGSTYPAPSTNPTLLALSSRTNLARAAEKELESLGRTSYAGREFLDVMTIKQILAMRDRQGVKPEVIERHLRLKEGVVGKLGRKGVVGEVR
ncbi:hypothetical protein VTO42DRAFT_1258 [Malbranchea cinnamomea]